MVPVLLTQGKSGAFCSHMSRIFFVNVWRKSIFDIYVTEYGTALTTILPILFLYLNTVTVTAGTFEP